MAVYKNPEFIQQSTDAAFDKLHGPGVMAPDAGIYRCVTCGHEIGIAKAHVLPAQGHAQHSAARGPIQWRLIVRAVHNR